MTTYEMKVHMTVLARLHDEAKEPDILPADYVRRGRAIQRILDNVEDKFGLDTMVQVVVKTSKQIGKTLAPLDISIVQKLVSKGCIINKIHKVASYKK